MVQDPFPRSDASPDDFLGFTVVRLAHLLQRRMDEVLLREVGVTARQFGALTYLARHPDIGSAALARHLLITAQSAGPLVEDLARRGYVARDEAAGAGLPKAIRLTVAGEAALAKGHAVAARLRAEEEAELAPGEAARVNAALLRLLRRLTGPETAS